MNDNWKAEHRIMLLEKWVVKDVSSSPCTDVVYCSSRSDCCGFSATLSAFVSDISLTYVSSSPCTAVRGTIAAHEVIVAVFQQRHCRSFRIQCAFVFGWISCWLVVSDGRSILNSNTSHLCTACKGFSGFHFDAPGMGSLAELI